MFKYIKTLLFGEWKEISRGLCIMKNESRGIYNWRRMVVVIEQNTKTKEKRAFAVGAEIKDSINVEWAEMIVKNG